MSEEFPATRNRDGSTHNAVMVLAGAIQIERDARPLVGRDSRAVWLAVLLFAGLSTWCNLRSRGFIAGDACMHYLAARFAFATPQYFVDIWNRPLVTALYAAPAWLWGRTAVRAVSMLIALACGWVAMRIARGQGMKRPALALIFTLGQPMLFFQSFGVMTELPFALLLGLAFLAYQNRRFALAAAIVAWAPLGRPEGFVVLALAAGLLLFHRRAACVLLLPIPIILWNLAGWQLTQRTSPWWRWLWDVWAWSEHSVYGRGNLLAFVALLPLIVSPLVLPATLLGIGRTLRDWKLARVKSDAIPAECPLLTAAFPVALLVGHSLLYWLGMMASFGEVRYLLVAAPFWGVMSARGWEWVFARLNWRHALAWAGAAVVAPPILANAFVRVVPVQFPPDWQAARAAAHWYQASPLRARYPKIASGHPGMFYFLDINPIDPAHVRGFDEQTLRDKPPGVILFWDPLYGDKNASADRALDLQAIRRGGWIEAATFTAPPVQTRFKDARLVDESHRHWHVFISPTHVK